MGRRKIAGEDAIKEEWVKKEIKKILDRFSFIHHYMPPSGMYGRSGIHDHIITQHGLSWTIEAKAGNNNVSDNQIVFARNIKLAGGISLIINEYHLDDVICVATYIDVFKRLPYHLCHNFDTYNDCKQWRSSRSLFKPC